MVDKTQILDDIIKTLIRLSDDVNAWKTYEKHDDITRELHFVANSMKNINLNRTLLLKALDAHALGYNRLAYNFLFSNKKLNSHEEEILNAKFRNDETNLTGQLVLMHNRQGIKNKK
ncbi:hypothetical protein CMI47_12810 [Candidatus Pacearchaeota archaeon]|nr:hypothetical protein [Candidatus Pacearchaeota archaeon]|tara:strand:- start:51570 stop:51920 length:351 start_codon:yes stop_codon:yes gene_type:complete